jgi:cholesterol 7-dehydrogenase
MQLTDHVQALTTSLAALVHTNHDALFYTGLVTLSATVYALYLRKFKFYLYHQLDDVTEEQANRPRGKCPPFFPNGWYSILNGDELKIRQVRFIDYCGREIVVFRGANGRVYALDAYCSHMGANLGLGGSVKNGQCIQCPFHGWIFDGETGACVQSFETKADKAVNQFEYNDLNEQTKIDGEYLHKCYEGRKRLWLEC